MKNILFCSTLLLSLCLLAACQDDQAGNSGKTETPPTETSPVESAGNGATVDVSPTHIKASDIAPFIGLWSYAKPVCRDIARQNYYEGRRIQYEGDGTFTYGKYTDQTNTGRYSFVAEDKILNLDFTEEKDTDMDWKTMHGVDVMIWVGNAKVNNSGDQIQLKRVPERPSKPVGK